MKFGLMILLNGLFVFSAAHIANVQITPEAVTHTIQPLLSLTTTFVQHWVG